MKTNLIFLHALSPLHAGTGQGVGAIDLPIAREKATGFPIVPGSTLKGVLRSNCENDDVKVRIFGPETGNASDYAGSAQFSDLRLLFLPVRSLAGTFAWVTSPLVLHRFARDCAMAKSPVFGESPNVTDEKSCLLPTQNSALTMEIDKQKNQVILEDLRLTGSFSEELQNLVNGLVILFTDVQWQELFKQRVCVVHDDVFTFLLDTATEITARIRMDKDKKTVEEGALWYEEALPAESILAGLMLVQEIKANADEVQQVIRMIAQNPLQVGGNSTVGRGLCRVWLVEAKL
jgi:CRISPR-associated protein Cmr4